MTVLPSLSPETLAAVDTHLDAMIDGWQDLAAFDVHGVQIAAGTFRLAVEALRTQLRAQPEART